MALDPRFVPITSLNEYFVDKDTGLPMANGTLSFFRDTARVTPKPVYRLTGAPPNYEFQLLPNPVTLSAVGTVEDGANNNVIIYTLPYDNDNNIDLYYVVAKNSGLVEQWVREAIPNLSDRTDPLQEPFPVTNQIANPQFSRIFFNELGGNTYDVTGAVNEEFRIAPDWALEVSGTGAVIVNRVLISGSENIVTSPPYFLDVSVGNGITKCFLRQRMRVNSGLWSSTNEQPVGLTGIFVVRNENVGQTALSLFYVESNGGSAVPVTSGSFDNSKYFLIRGSTENPIPFSNNTNEGNDGFIDIYFALNPSQHIRISSIQVVPVSTAIGTQTIEYDTQTSNREQALMGDYYIPALEFKPVSNVLIGWDFPLNPAQFGESGNIDVAAKYIWDQTIAYRNGATSMSYKREPTLKALRIETTGTAGAVAVQQYLDEVNLRNLIGSRFSLNINTWQPSNTGDVTARIYLFEGTSTAIFPTLPANIGTLNVDGTFTLTEAGWSEIGRNELEVPKFTLTRGSFSTVIDKKIDFMFNQWLIDTSVGEHNKFAIIVTYQFPAAAHQLDIQSVNLTPGNISGRPSPESFSNTLEKCQYFYEKSYELSTAVGTITLKGVLAIKQVLFAELTATSVISKGFVITFKKLKLKDPTVFIYSSKTGDVDRVNLIAWIGASTKNADDELVFSTNWPMQRTISTQSVSYNSLGQVIANVPNPGFDYVDIEFHYVADARIGIV